MKKKLFATAICLLMCAGYVFSAKMIKVIVTESYGKVMVKMNENAGWVKCYPGMTLDEKATVKTEAKGRATLMLYDGSKITVSQKSELLVKALTDNQKVLEQKSGKVRFKIAKLMQGKTFECKTPTAVCSIRGTEFTLDVGDDNQTELKVFEGLVAAAKPDGTGGEFQVGANQKMEFLKDLPPGAPTSFNDKDNEEESGNRREEMKIEAKAEINMDLSKEEVQKMAAAELKNAEYKQGKTIIDAFGQRVRIEEYIVRGAAASLGDNQFKLVVLNSRKDRFDWFQNIVSFNVPLASPLELKNANSYFSKWRDDWKKGIRDVDPVYFHRANQSGASNTVDDVTWGSTDGHVVNNAGTYTHIFDNYYFKINGVNKISYAPVAATINDITTDSRWTVDGQVGTMTYAQFDAWYQTNLTQSYPAGSDSMHTRSDLTFGTGNTYREEYISINDLGKIPKSTDYAQDKLKSNMEMVLSGSDFKGPGKKIDLCVEPKIFKDSGLIQ